jgi:hypothetical protein
VEGVHHSPFVLFGGVAEDLIVNLWRIEKCAGLIAGWIGARKLRVKFMRVYMYLSHDKHLLPAGALHVMQDLVLSKI